MSNTTGGFDLLAAWKNAALQVDLSLETQPVVVSVTDSVSGAVRFSPNVPIEGAA